MADITKLPPGIEIRKCPSCGYLMHQAEIDAARLDFRCPRCQKHSLREFVPDSPPEPPKPRKRKAA
ncbi:hypothetical protein [Thalassolituus oleivorans]|uniref:hypothetical protein n=1 Tax=Thalassolituus oleivorans TaxID=187493 RepID=UPI000347F390|nr:hypothetical protein [Thalassolituus oleivorans]